jgi:SNF2 family DNA or RNA helicase
VIITPHGHRLEIRAGNEETVILAALPIRRWDRVTDRWWVPNIPAIRSPLALAGAQLPPMPTVNEFNGLDASFQLKTMPRPYQAVALHASRDKHAFGYLMDPGTGKSKVMIDDGVAAHTRCELDAVFLVCPNSIKSNWEDELSIHHALPYEAHAYDSGKKAKAEAFIKARSNNLKWLIMGIESLSSEGGRKVAEAFVKAHKRCGIYDDESSRIKNFDASRTDAMIKLSRLAARLRIATGTPMTKGPQNAWSQMEFLDPTIFDLDYYPFRSFFCQMAVIPVGPRLSEEAIAAGAKQRTTQKIVGPKPESAALLFDMMAPFVFLARKEDVLPELPEKQHQVRKVKPSPEQTKMYHDLLADAELEGSRYSLALVRDLRLHQLTGGFYVTEEARIKLMALADLGMAEEMLAQAAEKLLYQCHPIPGANPKIEELMAIIDEMPDKKLVIFSRFRAEIEAVVAALNARGDRKAVEYHGGVDDAARTVARRTFQEDPSVTDFVAQVSTGGIGITLTAASYEVYLSNDWSAENRIQAEDRIHRIGQKDGACYIDIVLDGHFVDKRVLDSVRAGIDYHQFVMTELSERKK